jgi:hypothetical protein
MVRDIGKNPRKGSDTESFVIGNGEMMLTVLLGGKAKVAAGLPGNLVTPFAQCLGEFPAAQGAR